MASDRDTLAEAIARAGFTLERDLWCASWPDDEREAFGLGQTGNVLERREAVQDLRRAKVADYLIERGWRPPARTVTDPTEMDSWPLGAVVRGYGVAHQNVPGHVAGDPPLWIKPTGRLQTSAELLADCRGEGVTVLYQPEEETDDDDQ